jgi:hypothetical protein
VSRGDAEWSSMRLVIGIVPILLGTHSLQILEGKSLLCTERGGITVLDLERLSRFGG